MALLDEEIPEAMTGEVWAARQPVGV